jgi:tetratricopeptide (TPR) repeat protein
MDKYNSEALLNMAQDDRLRRDYATAVKRVRTALKGNEKNAKAYAVLARVYYDMGLLQLSKLVCVTGLQIDSSYPDLNNTLGLIHLRLSDVRAALTAFEAAVAADPTYVAARLNIGAITFNYRDYETSFRHFDVVAKREPKNQIAILSRAVALRGLNRLKEAETGYRNLLSLNPESVGAHYNLGILYQEYMSKPEDAIKPLEAVLQYERRDGTLRKDVVNRIKAIRIELKNKKEVEAMMREQKARQAKEEKASPQPPETKKK